MTQQTRQIRDAAYRRFVESGRIREADSKTLAMIDEHGPGTAREIYEAADPDMVYSTFQPGCTARLPAAGLVMQIDKRECSVTGETAAVWTAVIPDEDDEGPSFDKDEQETRREKRDRLLREGKVRLVCTGRWENMYEVDGDTETYLITVDLYGVIDCTCKWSYYNDDRCSHEMAVARKREEIGGR